MFENILFPVEKKPIIYNDKPTGRSMVIRSDTDDFISVVSDDYLLIPNKLVIDSVFREFGNIITMNNARLQRSVYTNTTYTSVSFDLKFPPFEVKVGDAVGAVLRIENSYDTSKALRVSMNALRLVCSNGMTVDKELFRSHMKHIGNVNAEQVVRSMIEDVKENGEKQFVGLNEVFVQMADTKLTPEIKKKFIKTVGSQPQYVVDLIVKQIMETDPKDLWDLYNCVTYVTTHDMDRTKFSTIKAEEDLNKSILTFLN